MVGFDDSPFDRAHRGDVDVVGTVYAGPRLDGILSGAVRRDGANAAASLTRMVRESGHRPQLLMLQGVALAGFNVVDVHALSRALTLPVLVVARRRPDREAVREALLTRVRGGTRKWALIERLGPMEPCAGVWVQRVGLTPAEAEAVVRRFAVNGRIPEPLRVAHLIAGGIATGRSRGRV